MDDYSLRSCPSCHEKEITGFHTCRFCGTRYDAIIQKNKVAIDATVICGALVAILFIVGIVYCGQNIKSISPRRLELLGKNIPPASKPRLVEFYTNWQGCAVGANQCNNYNAMVAECQSKYGTRIEFQRLNTDEENNNKLAHTLGGTFIIPLPAIYLFNRKGEAIAKFTDKLSLTELENALQDPELFK